MAIGKKPQVYRFILPLLEMLRELGGSARPAEAVDQVIEKMGISEKEQEVTNSKGQSRVRDQIHWARYYLAQSGHIDQSQHGLWCLSEKGRKVDLKTLDPISLYQDVLKKIAEDKQKGLMPDNILAIGEENEAPLDTPAIISDYKNELLKLLKSVTPNGFERICQRLLRENGFTQVDVTGKPGDEGIDGIGILQVNPFVSFKVVFQCKRYQETVSASKVRDFRGAMTGRADKGIIITTGSFTTDAKKEAHRDGVTPIELVDGEKLVEMFELLELGLKSVKTFEVDDAFFEDYR